MMEDTLSQGAANSRHRELKAGLGWRMRAMLGLVMFELLKVLTTGDHSKLVNPLGDNRLCRNISG